MHAVREATAADVPLLGRSLARAFDDDPVMTWLFPSPRRRPDQLARFLGYEIRHRLGTVWTVDDHAGGAVWAPPDRWRTPAGEVVRGLPFFLRLFGRRLPSALRLLGLVERHHPDEPHWYLAVLGTDPEHQGRGVGSALLAPVLARCDEEGLPAYLESSKRSNLAFYARHGFTVTGELTLPGGPTVWPMWRAARTA
jgi:ribosomal protein S18 acetylase RimI-like enzyme